MTSVKLIKLLMVMIALVAGCSGGGAKTPDTGATVEQEVLRVRTDAARGRLWVLGPDDVRIYDMATRQLIRRVELPGWSVAWFVCDPDLVLDAAGGAIISSNVQSRLWQIDGASFEVSERQVALAGRERWDVGFGALAFTADGSLLALTANAGSLWKIDAAGTRAGLVEAYHPPLKTCNVSVRRRR